MSELQQTKKKILIFAHYYAPDTASTGQLLQDLAESMVEHFEVTVICVVPSYGGTVHAGYREHRYYEESLNGVRILRVRVPDFTKANKFSRVRNILTYFIRAIHACRRTGEQDYIFTISQPPILGGLLGCVGKRIKHARMIYCIQDFNPEQVMAVHYSDNPILLRAMMAADTYSCRHADLVITVGRDLVETLKGRFKNHVIPHYALINNWIDEQQVYPLPIDHPKVSAFRHWFGLDDKFVIMYSGNIGLYYDLENLIKVIEQYPKGTITVDGTEVVFAFVGGGAFDEPLRQYKDEHHMDNVVFIPYQRREDLLYSLNAADVHWCVNAKGIKGVSCPSKAYGIMAVGRFMIGVLEKGGEVRTLIDECGCGYCCEPGDYDGVARNIDRVLQTPVAELYERGAMGRSYLEQNLTKSANVGKYIDAIKAL